MHRLEVHIDSRGWMRLNSLIFCVSLSLSVCILHALSGAPLPIVRTKMTDDKKPPFRVSFKNFMTNRLMQRKQFNIEIEHPGRSTVPKKEIQQKISQIFKIQVPECWCWHWKKSFFSGQEENTIVLFGFRTKFGGGRSTGHGMIYDNLSICKRYEPKYRLIRVREFLQCCHFNISCFSWVWEARRRVQGSRRRRRRTEWRSTVVERKPRGQLLQRRSKCLVSTSSVKWFGHLLCCIFTVQNFSCQIVGVISGLVHKNPNHTSL